MISEAKWKATRGEATSRRLARTAQLAIAAAAFLILSVLPIQAQTDTVLHSFAGAPTRRRDSLRKPRWGCVGEPLRHDPNRRCLWLRDRVRVGRLRELQREGAVQLRGDGRRRSIARTGLVVDGTAICSALPSSAAAQRPANSGAEPCSSLSTPPGTTPRMYCTVSRAPRTANRRSALLIDVSRQPLRNYRIRRHFKVQPHPARPGAGSYSNWPTTRGATHTVCCTTSWSRAATA